MSEHLHVLLPLGFFLLFVVGSIAFSNRSRRRRAENFAAWAAIFGANLERLSESSARFVVTFGDREIEFRDTHSGGGPGATLSATQHLTVSTKLRGRSWDLHSVEITRRRTSSESFEKRFNVQDLGMPMRDAWPTPPVREAIAASFAPSHEVGRISIHAGQLMFWLPAGPRPLPHAAFDSLLTAHVELATQIERAR